MPYSITQNCIGCRRCLSACPTQAIQTNGTAFWIERDRCSQCEGMHGVPQCWATCPTNAGCVPLLGGVAAVPLSSVSEASEDYWESWFATYTRLVARLQSVEASSYWHTWFNGYAQALSRLQATAV